MESDHDLLITLHEQVKGIREDIKEIREGTGFTDHEIRIRRLEWLGSIAVGLSIALQFYFNFIK
jgi:hypothetical protein